VVCSAPPSHRLPDCQLSVRAPGQTPSGLTPPEKWAYDLMRLVVRIRSADCRKGDKSSLCHVRRVPGVR